jgi:hypothetical protein
VVTTNHGLRDNDTWDATQRDTVVVHAEKPQVAGGGLLSCGAAASGAVPAQEGHTVRRCLAPSAAASQRPSPLCFHAAPQEVFMWETFCGLVARVREGGQPDPFWPRVAEATQRVLFAVERSARQGGCEVPVARA